MIAVGTPPLEGAHDFVAGGVLDRPPLQRVPANADAVVVEVARLHHVPERQCVGAAAAEERCGAQVLADRKHDRQIRLAARDVDVLGKLDLDPDLFAHAVGRVGCRSRNDAYVLAPQRGPDAVHLVIAVFLQRFEPAIHLHAYGVHNGASLQGVGSDADSIVVGIPVLHAVTKRERFSPAARGQRRIRRAAADLEYQHRIAGRMDHRIEPNLDLDDLADPVVRRSGLGVRRDLEHGIDTARFATVHRQARVRRHRPGARVHCISRIVSDRRIAQLQRVRGHTKAVIIPIFRFDRVVELQRRRPATAGERCGPRMCPDGKQQGRFAGQAGDMNHPVPEDHVCFYTVAGPEPFGARRREDAHRGHCHGVCGHPVSGLPPHRWYPTRRRAGDIRYGVRRHQCVRASADPIVVAIANLDLVAERKRSGAAAVGIGCAFGLRPDSDEEMGLLLAGHVHVLVEGHRYDDRVSRGVGAVRSWIRGDSDPGNRRFDRVDLVLGAVDAGHIQRTPDRIARLVRDSPPLQRPRPDGNAVAIDISRLHRVRKDKHLRPRPFETRPARPRTMPFPCIIPKESDQQDGTTGNPDDFAELNLHLNPVARHVVIVTRVRHDSHGGT